MNLYDLFKAIEKKAGLYLGHVSIKNLFMFYHGYLFARRDLQVPNTEQEIEFCGFQKWIEEKYNTTTCHSWASIILLNSEDDKAAFWKFFDLLDKYLEFTRSKD